MLLPDSLKIVIEDFEEVDSVKQKEKRLQRVKRIFNVDCQVPISKEFEKLHIGLVPIN